MESDMVNKGKRGREKMERGRRQKNVAILNASAKGKEGEDDRLY